MLKLLQNLYAAVLADQTKVCTAWAHSQEIAEERMARVMSPKTKQKWVSDGREVIRLK